MFAFTMRRVTRLIRAGATAALDATLRSSIRWRLVASYVLMSLLTIGALGLMALTLVRRYADQQETAYLATHASVTARRALPFVWPQVDGSRLADLARYAAFWGDVQVRIVDTQGQTLADSGAAPQNIAGVWLMPGGDPAFTVRQDADGAIILTLRDGLPGLFVVGEDSRHREEDWPDDADPTYLRRPGGEWGGRFVLDPQANAAANSEQTMPRSTKMLSAPIQAGNTVVGHVQLSNGPDFGADVLPTTRRALGLAALSASLLAALVGVVVSRGLAAPVRNLTVAAEKMHRGDLSARAPVQGRDEIGLLAQQFNRMAAALQTSFAALEAERDALRRFVADASHELRTPITALKTFNELLQGPAAQDFEAQAEFLAESRTQLARLEWITTNLLDLSRLDGGLVQLDLENHDVGDLLEAAAAPFRLRAQEKGVTLTVEAPPVAATVMCDRARVEMLLANLLDNALKFTPAGGSVTMGAGLRGTGLVFWVQDSGPGIEPDELPRIFERFYRGRTSRGTGLGLAIAQGIAGAHGGHVTVQSQPGRGSRFETTLPGVPATPQN